MYISPIGPSTKPSSNASVLSVHGEQHIHAFIHVLTTQEDLNPNTLREYAGDLKQFISWFETSEYQDEDILYLRSKMWLCQH